MDAFIGLSSMFLIAVSLLAIFVFTVIIFIYLAKKESPMKRDIIGLCISTGVLLISIAFLIIAFNMDSETPVIPEETKAVAVEPKEEKTPEEIAEEEKKKELVEKTRKTLNAKHKELEAKEKAEEETKKVEEEAKIAEEARLAEEAKIAEQEAKNAEERANAKTIEFAQLDKNPDEYILQYVKYTGEIVEISEGGASSYMRVAVTEESYGYNHSDIILVQYEGTTDFVKDDIVTFYGMVMGGFTYKSRAGWDVTVPSVIADAFE